MTNKLQVKVTLLKTKEDNIEYHFDYYDRDGIIVGTIAVDNNGKLGWLIWNQEHSNSILTVVSYIFGMKVENSVEDIIAAKKEEPSRFDRAKEYINNNGLIVNNISNFYNLDRTGFVK